MPPPHSSKRISDIPDFHFFSTLRTDSSPSTENTSKLHSKKKSKKKNNETPAEVAEQFDQEKTTQRVSKPSDEYGYGIPEPDKSPNLLITQMAKKQNTYTLPVFAALGEAFRESSTEGQDHDDDTLETFSRSPTTKQELVSTSPPDDPPPSQPQPVPFSRSDDIRGGFSPPTTISPRLAYRQLSRRPSGYAHQPESLPTSPRGRPVSMPAHMFHLPSPSGFNLNNMRGIAGDMIGNNSRSTSRKGTRYNFMSLDSLANAGDPTTNSDNVLLAAYENSLYVFHLGKEKASRIGQIDGLRGQVVSAKIIPCPNLRGPLKSRRPLVAVIVHGPEAIGEDLSRPSSRQSDHSFGPSWAQHPRAVPSFPKYQTTVEVYSLKQQMHVMTLLASKSEEPRVNNVFGKKSYEPPGPIGSLSIHLTSEYIAIASKESGEIYLYDQGSGYAERPFRCIGKIWTSVPAKRARAWSSSSAPEMAAASRDGSPTRENYEAPLLALQGHLLVYVPPIASSRSTIFSRVRLANAGRDIPGLRSHTASSQPQATLQLDTPLDGSKVNEIARGVTQEVLKGASWVGNQGVQAWKNYWSPRSEINAQPEQPFQNQFPPTHAPDDSNRVPQHPTVISFLDLSRLAELQHVRPEHALHPMASFILPGGCSFMSLNPSGLGLFTASAKGDVQNVWDLMQIVHPKTLTPSIINKYKDPTIRQIARFTRVTEANIVDVAWLGSRGKKLAILTDRGTVHLHDLPVYALSWPPRPIIYNLPTEGQKIGITDSRSNSSSWRSAFSAVSSGAQTISVAVRSNPLARFSDFNLAQASAAAGMKSGKIAAAGFSRSVEAASGTVNTIMSIGETRLHLPGGTKKVSPGSTGWWISRNSEAIAVVGDGIIRVHKVDMRQEKKPGKKKYSVVGPRITELAITEPKERHDNDWDLVNDGFDITGDWLSMHPTRKHSKSRSTNNPLPFAEIDTSSPYRPIQIGYRVDLERFSSDTHHEGEEAWSFGQAISCEPFSFDDDPAQDEEEHGPALDLDIHHEDEIDSKLVNRIEEALPIPDPLQAPIPEVEPEEPKSVLESNTKPYSVEKKLPEAAEEDDWGFSIKTIKKKGKKSKIRPPPPPPVPPAGKALTSQSELSNDDGDDLHDLLHF